MEISNKKPEWKMIQALVENLNGPLLILFPSISDQEGLFQTEPS